MPDCHYAANKERAEVGAASGRHRTDPAVPPYSTVATPNQRTIAEICDFLKVEEAGTAKLLVFLVDDKPVAALIRGDHEANEAKVRRAFGGSSIAAADAATVEKATGVPLGFLGPVDMKIPLVVDRSVAALPTVVVGGNEVDVHLTGVVPGRDFPLDQVLDLRDAVAGDPCPRCGSAMVVNQGIEIGHVFKLGTKYSKAMGATFLDDKGQEIPVIMGCYGIGVNRIVAAAVEAAHDANGIIWPITLAPYHVLITPLQGKDPAVMETAELLEDKLQAAGYDVLVDDREQRPGVKFKDADLIGIPLRIVIGDRGLKEGNIEVKWRTDAAAHTVPAASAFEAIQAELAAAVAAVATLATERQAARARRKGGMTPPPRPPLPRAPVRPARADDGDDDPRPVPDRVRPPRGGEPELAPRPPDRVGDGARDLGRRARADGGLPGPGLDQPPGIATAHRARREGPLRRPPSEVEP